MVKLSLDGMLKGGIHDHVGGGFHRYSIDEKWLVPHFEKMLYDQALLAIIYLEAYQLLKQPDLHSSNSEKLVSTDSATQEGESYRETAMGILDYIMRNMQDKDGGFYSATDADSLTVQPDREKSPLTGKKEEGFYFTWMPEEIDQVLSQQQSELIKAYYGVTSQGNFEGRNVLYVSKNLSEAAKELNLKIFAGKKDFI